MKHPKQEERQEERELAKVISDLRGLAYILEAVTDNYGLDTQPDKPGNGRNWGDLYHIAQHISTALKMDAGRLDGVLSSLSEA